MSYIADDRVQHIHYNRLYTIKTWDDRTGKNTFVCPPSKLLLHDSYTV